MSVYDGLSLETIEWLRANGLSLQEMLQMGEEIVNWRSTGFRPTIDGSTPLGRLNGTHPRSGTVIEIENCYGFIGDRYKVIARKDKHTLGASEGRTKKRPEVRTVLTKAIERYQGRQNSERQTALEQVRGTLG